MDIHISNSFEKASLGLTREEFINNHKGLCINRVYKMTSFYCIRHNTPNNTIADCYECKKLLTSRIKFKGDNLIMRI